MNVWPNLSAFSVTLSGVTVQPNMTSNPAIASLLQFTRPWAGSLSLGR